VLQMERVDRVNPDPSFIVVSAGWLKHLNVPVAQRELLELRVNDLGPSKQRNDVCCGPEPGRCRKDLGDFSSYGAGL
jgi:hypothetical protein